jgi:glutaredoxin
MFLILGHTKCKFCNQAKELLNENNLNFKYEDLFLKYGEENWKNVFSTLRERILDQKSIPIVFMNNNDETIVDLEKLDETWRLIGTYQDLVTYIDNMDLTIDDNY